MRARSRHECTKLAITIAKIGFPHGENADFA